MRKDPERDAEFWTSKAGRKKLAIAKSRRAALDVKCYECGATPGAPCRFPNGALRRAMHSLRFELAED